MVGELQVVFRLHPVAIVLRGLRERRVLVELLGGVAPGAAVDPVGVVATPALIAIAAAAPTVVVTIAVVVQGILFPRGRV